MAATFGALLRRFRLAAGLTQEELAERALLSARGISDLERDINTRPRPHTVRQLTDALQLGPGDRELLGRAATGQDPGSSPATNLPFELTPLIGREREVADALHMLRWDGVRLLTLTGPGGVGKTRLAQAVAGAMLAETPDGVTMVSLAPVRDPGLVVQAVVSTLGLREEAGRTPFETLAGHLQSRVALLLLDNVEQVASAAPQLVELLGRCPSLRIVVTSRVPLHVRGEHQLDVPPLTPPDEMSGRVSSREPVSRNPAVTLFVQRARAVKRDFALSEDNWLDVARVCRSLDGLPLAIELAAAQARFLTPRMLVGQLERRLDLLSAGARDLPPRQRTMRDAIAWSYDLLAAEQRLFTRLAVFVGGFDVAAVSAVCAGPGDLALDPLRGMLALVDVSLVTVDERAPTDVPRFTMLETIREYAQEQLELRGEESELAERHADYFLAMAEEAEARLWGLAAPTDVTRRIDAELDNVRAALTWYLEHGRASGALRLAGALGMYWHFTGRLSEGRRWLQRALDAAPDATDADRARALCHLGAFAMHQADHPRALRALEDSLSLWQALDEPRWRALTLFRIAHVWRDAGDLDRAAPLFEASLAISHGRGEEWGVVRGGPLMLYGTLLLERGDAAAAVERLEEALDLGRRSGSPVLTGGALNGLAWTAYAAGEPARAGALAEEALLLYSAAGDRQGRSDALATCGWLALWSDDLDTAARHFADLLALASERGKKRQSANALRGLALVAFARGDLARGARQIALAATLWSFVDVPHRPSRETVETRVAQARAQLGEPAWQAAWAAGESRPPDVTIAEALTEWRPTTATDSAVP